MMISVNKLPDRFMLYTVRGLGGFHYPVHGHFKTIYLDPCVQFLTQVGQVVIHYMGQPK